jgi:hypothetical protein
MTLITRLIREDDVFIAGDKDIFNERGEKITVNGRSTIEKLVKFDKPVWVAGVAGLLETKTNGIFSVIELMIEVHGKGRHDNTFSNLFRELKNMFAANCPEKVKENAIIILVSGIEKEHIINRAIVKKRESCFTHNNYKRYNPENLFDMKTSKALCNVYELDEDKVESSFNEKVLFEKFDFNINYTPILGNSNKHYPKICYTLLHLYIQKIEFDIESIAEKSDSQIDNILSGYYSFVKDSYTHLASVYNNLNLLKAVGELKSLVKISKELPFRLK